ncbi:MAG TPA: hypothetical protein VFC58_15600 [Desulfosporosinus sp.]|nr:hypothetical protein [Desulfosporosinus sp.]
MKNFKRLIAVATIIGTLGVVGVAGASYATGATTPAGIVSALTGKSVEAVTAERAAGATYGTIAQEDGKLDEFKTENLGRKKAMLDQRVKDGTMPQAQADAMVKSIEANQATCDGTSSAKMGQKNGMGSGQGMDAGRHSGGGMGRGMNTGNSSTQ